LGPLFLWLHLWIIYFEEKKYIGQRLIQEQLVILIIVPKVKTFILKGDI
jgi:hypothetical protein